MCRLFVSGEEGEAYGCSPVHPRRYLQMVGTQYISSAKEGWSIRRGSVARGNDAIYCVRANNTEKQLPVPLELRKLLFH